MASASAQWRALVTGQMDASSPGDSDAQVWGRAWASAMLQTFSGDSDAQQGSGGVRTVESARAGDGA